METYLELDESIPTITALVKEDNSEDFYVHTVSSMGTKVYRVRRQTLAGKQAKALELMYHREANTNSIYSTDIILRNKVVLFADTVGDSQIVRDSRGGPCFFTINRLNTTSTGIISLVMSGDDMYIGRSNIITRVADVTSRLNCALATDTRYALHLLSILNQKELKFCSKFPLALPYSTLKNLLDGFCYFTLLTQTSAPHKLRLDEAWAKSSISIQYSICTS